MINLNRHKFSTQKKYCKGDIINSLIWYSFKSLTQDSKMTPDFFNRCYHQMATVFLFVVAISFTSTVTATSWPQELTGDKGTIVIYQPQPEKLQGNQLTGRAAMQLELKGKDAPIFGVFWFSSTIETDRDTNSVIMEKIKVTKVAWPESSENSEQQFTNFVEKELQNSSFTGSLSKLTATLTSAEKVKKSLENIKNDPPVIIFKDKLAVLLTYDGKPIFQDIENSPYQRALNTQFAVVKVKGKPQYYLTSGSLWYSASTELGPWQATTNVPADLIAMIAKANETNTNNKPTKTPEVVTATKATELVVSEGKPNWVSLTGGKLLYVKNTETPWIREIEGGDMYILLSGRWFKSKSTQGPWAFVRADKLPTSFKDIPPESDIGGLRSSVAGTAEADQAVLDAQIPQTAAIQRSEAKLTVQYDGEPKFERIKGTDVDYAVNTATQVLRISGKYYAVDNAVWFVASNAKGPWIVADSIPTDAIAEIPPSSPVYNTTYVKVYDSTPTVVYVGYTPGYMWSYPYYGVPIYGTGWYYPPYYGGWYYPRPPTWGMHIGYNPWTGWGVGISWGSPFFRVGISWSGGYHNHYRGGYYGGYHGGYHGGRHTNININGNVNIGNSVSIGNRAHIKNNIAKQSGGKINNNLYNKPSNRKRNATRATPSRNIQKAKPATQRANNVYADRGGNVLRHQNGQWQNRSNKSWNSVPKQRTTQQSKQRAMPTTTQSRAQPRTNHSINNSGMNNRGFNHQNMNRARQSRSMGGGFSGGRGGFGGRR